VDACAACTAHLVFPNPNAPTGLRIAPEDVARIAAAHPGRLVVIDEAPAGFITEALNKLN
jgi:histidinol-phosphate aminotransferase